MKRLNWTEAQIRNMTADEKRHYVEEILTQRTAARTLETDGWLSPEGIQQLMKEHREALTEAERKSFEEGYKEGTDYMAGFH